MKIVKMLLLVSFLLIGAVAYADDYPDAQISERYITVTLGETVCLDGFASQNVTGYQWDVYTPFGSGLDPFLSSAVAFCFEPDIEGEYQVELTVFGPGGEPGMDMDTDMAWITVLPGPNQPPYFTFSDPFPVTMTEDQGPLLLTLYAADPETDPFDYTLETGPAHGSVTFNGEYMPQCEFSYTPDLNYHGPDSFVVSIDDGQGGGGDTLTVTIEITNPQASAEIVAAVTAACAAQDQLVTELKQDKQVLLHGDFDRDNAVTDADLEHFADRYGAIEIDVDNDLDTYSEIEDDCDDSDPSLNPGATEICGDGIDNNCNGEIDEVGCQ